MMIKSLISILLIPILFLLRVVITKDNIIVFSSSNNYKYSGNTKYLFEYLNINSKYQCYWITESDDIIKYLESKKYNYISNNNIISKLLILLRCKIMISSGTSFYDPYNIVSNDKKMIKICTMHGTGPKLTIERSVNIEKTLKIIKDINQYNYVAFCTDHACTTIGVNQLVLPKEKTRILGSPKQDKLYDKKSIIEIYNQKKWTRLFMGEDYNDQKIIYYAPTFRDFKSDIPIKDLIDFNDKKFNEFLSENKFCLLYSYHSMSNFDRHIKDSKNIKFIDDKKYPLFDNIELMCEVDMFLGDYSTLSTDFLILRKPQAFIMPDFEKVRDTKGFAENIKGYIPGEEIKTFSELKNTLATYLSNPEIYLEEFSEQISYLESRYIGYTSETSCKRFLDLINKVITK